MKQILPNISYRGNSHLPTLIIALPDIMYAEMISEWNFDCQFRTLAVLESGFNCIRTIRDLKPDFVLIDSELSHTSGFELAEKLRLLNSNIKIILYASRKLPEYVSKYLDKSNHNIYGFIHKGCGINELELCFSRVFSGQKYLSNSLDNYLNDVEIESTATDSILEKISSLCNREKSVWDLLKKGKTEKEIGDILCIGINTVKTYKRRIKEKLDYIGKGKLTYLALKKNFD
jgi:DNA-binding NarL/FixJ family response regulator